MTHGLIYRQGHGLPKVTVKTNYVQVKIDQFNSHHV